MVFIVPDVVRYSVNQSTESVPVVNVLDYQIDTTGSTMTRAEACEAHAGIILSNWADHVMNSLADDLTASSVSWVDLDDEDGTTGSVTTGPETDFPINGSSASPPVPGGVAYLVKKRLQGASRARRDGRLYLSGVTIGGLDVANGSLMDATFRGTVQGRLNTFFGDVDQEDAGPAGHQAHMVVVHVLTRDPDTGAPLTGDYTLVDDLVVDSRIAFQRRRSLRG